MRVLDLSFHAPASNLALDEVLLNSAERGIAGESLRFWESPVPFVVVGVSQRILAEVRHEACVRDGVPVLRRCSAGGCVLQGPGSLNLSLVLSYDRHPSLRNIRDSYCHILGRLREALETRGVRASLEGISDLAVEGLKVSGNAQKRRKHFFLHHGTFLYHVDWQSMGRYLREPQERPAYRGARSHSAFVSTLPLGPHELRGAIRDAFEAHSADVEPLPIEFLEVREIASRKYSEYSWTYRR
ncbi:MAG TPA: lipoate--protein ligase family protein [Candidatus Hydrogenedentes bacterium]|nr:lipoate--protein ligase family protein [Candidatus Hydrogenedentota bacterium]